MKHFKRYDKRYNKMLWIGIAVWALSIVLNWIIDLTGGTVPSQDALMDMGKDIYQSSPWLCLFTICLFGPLLEEVSFRLWGRGKVWCVIVSLLLMAAFTCGEMMSWWPLLIVAVMAVVRFVDKDTYRRNWILALASSVLFTICHLSGFSSFSFGTLLVMMEIFGFAMVLCYLTLNLSFWFSVLLHVLNNSLAVVIPLLCFGEPYSATVEGCAIEAEPAKALTKYTMIPSFDRMVDSTGLSLQYFGDMSEVVCRINLYGRHQHPDTLYDWVGSDASLETRYFVCLDADTSFAGYRSVARDLMRQYEITVDTSVVDACEIWIVDALGEKSLLADRPDHETIICQLLSRKDRGTTRYWHGVDTAGVPSYWCVCGTTNSTVLSDTYDKVYGYRVEYRPHHQITAIKFRHK